MKRRTSIAVLTAGLASLLSVLLTLISPQVAAQNLEEVTFLLPAPEAQVAFAPWMLARSRGYYAAEGLKVTFQPGRGGVDVAKQVGAGNAARPPFGSPPDESLTEPLGNPPQEESGSSVDATVGARPSNADRATDRQRLTAFQG